MQRISPRLFFFHPYNKMKVAAIKQLSSSNVALSNLAASKFWDFIHFVQKWWLMYIPGHKSTSNQWKGNWSSQPLWWSVNFDRDGSFLKSNELQWNVWFAAGIFGHSHSPSFSKICFSSPCFFASSPQFAESRTDLVHDLSLCDFPRFDVATKPTMVNGCIRSYDMIYINIYIYSL